MDKPEQVVWGELRDCAARLGFSRCGQERLTKSCGDDILHGVELVSDQQDGSIDFKPCLSLYFSSLTNLACEAGLPIGKSAPVHFFQLNQLAYDNKKTRRLSDYRVTNEIDINIVSRKICSDFLQFGPAFFERQHSLNTIIRFFEDNQRAGGVFHDGYLAGLYFLSADFEKCVNFIQSGNIENKSPIVKKFHDYLVQEKMKPNKQDKS